MKLCRLAVYALAITAGPVLWAQAVSTPASPADAPDAAQVAELVLANHILANEGVVDAYGHVSVRDARNPNHFLLAKAAPAGAVTAADIIEYDMDGNPVRPTNGDGYLERFIHAEIYKSRPDVMSVIHSHSADVIPFTVTSVPLRPMIHVAGFIPQTVKVFDNRPVAGMTDLLIRTPALGHALAKALGSDPLILLRGHGDVIVGPSLHVAVGRAYYTTVDARTELQAILLSGGKVTYLAPEEADKAATQDGYERGWTLWKSKLLNK